MTVSFIERFGAYIIDSIILSVIVSLICFNIPSNDSDIEKRLTELNKQYTTSEITTKEFYSGYNDILYENQKNNIMSTSISLILTIGYFVVFQFMNKGQTLGKKLLHLRIVDKDSRKTPTMVKFLIRSLIALGILSTAINLLVISIFSKKTYIPCYYTVSIIEIIFIVVSIALIIFKDGRGLHDMMANTKVIKEGRWLNAWIYWSRINS